MAAEAPKYEKGDDVYVFYRMDKRCLPHRKYFAALDPRHGAYRPRSGMSEGWVPARVVEVDDSGEKVSIEYRWPHFFTQRGRVVDTDNSWFEWYPTRDVIAASTLPKPQPHSCFVPPGVQPELAIITFRWGGLNEIVAPSQWGDTGSSVSDTFIESFIDSAVVPTLGNKYEIWTVYIESWTDLDKIADTAHLIFGSQHPARRAKHTCGMYFLYPTGFEENCVPNMETGEDNGAALVAAKSLFRAIQSVERAGIPTRFPHPSGFYELLTSKRWTYMMSLVPHLRVPPTVSLPRMLVERSWTSAAASALSSLQMVKNQQAILRNETATPSAITKGVAKLGFSWEALDVKFWEGRQGLENAIYALTQKIEISQEYTGQPHDLEFIIVQEYVPHDLELRVYVVNGKVETLIYTKFSRIKENLEFGDFSELFERGEAARQWMGGDVAALQEGERQCIEVTKHWLAWVQGQLCEMPPAIRFDYFIGRGKEPGSAVVWTLEICELGFSMLGEKTLPSKVFAAMLRSCLGSDAPAIEAPAAPASAAAAAAAAAAADGGPTRSEPAGESQDTPMPSDPTSAACDAATKQPEAPKAPQASSDPAPEPAAEAANLDQNGYSNLIMITVPPGTSTTDQQKCSGVYKLVPGVHAAGEPVWKLAEQGDQRWLYLGKDRYWYVGDDEEKDLEFDCSQGYIRHEARGAMTPYTLSGPWETYRTDKSDWKPDKRIVVVASGAEGQVPRPKGKGQGKGKGGKPGRHG